MLVGVDGVVAGVIVMADELRPDALHIVEALRSEGVRHVAMVSGDRRSVADRVGRELGVDRVYAPSSHRRTSSRWSGACAARRDCSRS